MGAAYVLEGSTLGGLVLASHLERTLALPVSALRYLRMRGRQTLREWRRFLAGLIACHHYSGPRLVPLAVRDTAEYLGNALSWQLHVLEGADRAEKARSAQCHETEVVRAVAVTRELLDGLDTPALLAVASATGAAIVLEEGTRRVGDAPPPEAIALIVEWLQGLNEDVYATDHLARDIPAAVPHESVAAGLLAVSIARDLGEYILWFRPAVTQTVDWAGDPRKSVTRPARHRPQHQRQTRPRNQ
jgi:chemotaxis family two-component system sensor kinase Cph1